MPGKIAVKLSVASFDFLVAVRWIGVEIVVAVVVVEACIPKADLVDVRLETRISKPTRSAPKFSVRKVPFVHNPHWKLLRATVASVE